MRTTVRNALGSAWQKRWVVWSVVIVLALGLVLAAVRLVAIPAFVGAPDHVRVVVTRIPVPIDIGTHTIIFDRQASGVVAEQVYAQLVAGERIPNGAIVHCPAYPLAPYYHYDLTFARAGIQTSVAHSAAVGCQVLELDTLGGGRDVYSWYAADGVSFWEAFHQRVDAPLPI